MPPDMTVPFRDGLGFGSGGRSSSESRSSSPKSERAFEVAGVPTSWGSMANMGRGEWDAVEEEASSGEVEGKSYEWGSFEKSSSRKREKRASSAEEASRLKKSSILYGSSMVVTVMRFSVG